MDWLSNNPSLHKPSIDVLHFGDIDLAEVGVDGKPLFRVAAASPDTSSDTNVLLPIERRVLSIESKLTRIIEANFDPDRLDVRTGTLNNQPVVLVGETSPRLSVVPNFSLREGDSFQLEFEQLPFEAERSPIFDPWRSLFEFEVAPEEVWGNTDIFLGVAIVSGTAFSNSVMDSLPTSAPLISRVVVTVTELDEQFSGQSATAIAWERANAIREALLRAQAERQPEYLRQQVNVSGRTLAAIAIASFSMMLLQRLFRARWNVLAAEVYTEDSEEYQLLATSPMPWDRDSPPLASATDDSQASLQSVPVRLWWWIRKWLGGGSPLWEILFPTLSLVQRQNINLLVRSLLWWSQTALWVGGIAFILARFPFSRALSSWMISVPVKFLIIWFAGSLGRRLTDIAISVFLHRWAERRSLSTTEARRMRLRVPTIARALKELTSVFTYAAVAVAFLYLLRTPFLPVLLGAGIVGVGSQNLIKDWLAGLFVLWEDQYARGDVVTIDGTFGKVEYMNLRMTQLRTPDGELVSISNGSFDQVKNATNRWSRANIGIDVAYKTDLDKAIAVIESVAYELEADTDWGRWIVEPPKVLGVDNFDDSCITIRLWIKTRPMKQWDVGREFRRRLKEAFDRNGITIPFPQRRIWFENFSPNNALGDSAIAKEEADE